MTLQCSGGSTARGFRIGLTVAVLLLAAATAHAATSSPPPSPPAIAANATNNPINGDIFVPGSIYNIGLSPALSLSYVTSNPGPQSSTVGFTDLAFVPNAANSSVQDLVALDDSGNGFIYRYFGPNYAAAGTQTNPNPALVWCGNCDLHGPWRSLAEAIGPDGTLYVVSNDSDGIQLDLWAFPKLATAQSGYGSPVLVDNINDDDLGWPNNISPNVPSGTYASSIRAIAVAPANATGALNPGDLVMLVGDQANLAAGFIPPIVVRYRAADVAASIACHTANVTCPTEPTPFTIANSSDLVATFTNTPNNTTTSHAFGGGLGGAINSTAESARDLAFWPADGSLLVLSDAGLVYRFEVTGDPLQVTGLPFGGTPIGWTGNDTFTQHYTPNRVATGVMNGGEFALATASYANLGTSVGALFELDGTHAPTSVTETDGALAGLVVLGSSGVEQPPQTGSAPACIRGCNITGGFTQKVTGTPAAIRAVRSLTGAAATITETVCLVEVDPRGPSCGATAANNYTPQSLPVEEVCPGFGNTTIPDYMCGNYGPGGAGTGTGFLLILGEADGVDAIPNLLWYTEAFADFYFGTTSPNPCPVIVPGTLVAWGPRSDSSVEGLIPEGTDLTESTYGCGSGRGLNGGASVSGFGMALTLFSNTPEAQGTATGPQALLINFANFKFRNLLTEISTAPIQPNAQTRLAQIVTRAEALLNSGCYDCAARKLVRADRYVEDHAGAFGGIPGTNPNAYGRIRSRLANLYLTIHSRIQGHLAPPTWPVTHPSESCDRDQDIDPDTY